MKIISKFHDYYDTCMQYGMDKECIYIREMKEISEVTQYTFDFPKMKHPSFGVYPSTLEITPFVVGFCSEIIVGIKLYRTSSFNKGYQLEEAYLDYFYTLQQVEDYLTPHIKEWGLDRKNRWTKSTTYDCILELVKNYFKLQPSKNVYEIFHLYNTPIFVFDKIDFNSDYYFCNPKTHLIINPKLSTFKFYRIKDVYQAFQTIYQYISGVLGVGNKEIVEISNKDMCIKKGFDPKTSFRNPITFKQLQKMKTK